LGCFQGIKQPGHELGWSSLSSAEVKNEWSCTSTPPTCLHGVSHVKLSQLWWQNKFSGIWHHIDT
jgi:hypothetical protein